VGGTERTGAQLATCRTTPHGKIWLPYSECVVGKQEVETGANPSSGQVFCLRVIEPELPRGGNRTAKTSSPRQHSAVQRPQGAYENRTSCPPES
jgi:hypothetical protein